MYQYDIQWYVNEGGTQVKRLILHLPEEVELLQVKADCFCVYTERRDEKGDIVYARPIWYEKELKKSVGYRTILAAYPSNKEGEPVQRGKYVVLELDMSDALSRTLIDIGQGNRFVDCVFRVTQVKEIGNMAGMVFDEQGDIQCPQTKGWKNAISSYEKLPLKYGFYTPSSQENKPLIIWLHGAGEGGTDPRVAYMGNEVVALSSDKVQSYFGAAWVLAPQTPTMWMDDGSHKYGRTGKSMYVQALKALIDEFVETYRVDRNRIYIGGCSNGGFMTMRMVIDYPDYFAAAYPMCEALYDETITDEKIKSIRHVPIWMLHAMTDGVVNPEETSVPTYKRLIKAGAENVHLTYIDDRPPHPMINHACWIKGLKDKENYDFHGEPVLVDGKAVTRFQWLAAQRRKEKSFIS